MRKILSGLLAATMAVSVVGTSAMAAPMIKPAAPAGEADVTHVQMRPGVEYRIPGDRGVDRTDVDRVFRDNGRRDDFRRDFRRGDDRRDRDFRAGPRRGFYADGGSYYYNGHRGYRSYRQGYREYNGVWFPAAAFIAGAVIGGAINNNPGVVVRSGSSSHVSWCANRYRSYRSSDNTFQPYSGPRQQCYSPYS